MRPLKSNGAENRKNVEKRILPVCLALVLITVIFYWPIFSADFIDHDDPDYITQNPVVQKGLTGEGIAWAFTSRHASNWHPMTWLSHMLDCQLFGLNPSRHHAVNLFFHATNAILLFLVLRRMTNGLWRSAIVAALFALHPAHVESVAWVSERKDVLSTFFGLIALWFYIRYAQSSATHKSVQRMRCYIFTLAFFVLSLMSKPMLVTFPFVLLLLDFWPLKRTGLLTAADKTAGAPPLKNITGLIFEKLPFFVLAFIDCWITIWAQEIAVAKVDVLPLGTRVANMFVSYLRYTGKLVLPTDLAMPYPYRTQLPLLEIMAAILFLLGMTALVLWFLRRKSYLAPGWFWFVGTLVPVIGLIQVGQQSMADRYTYVPSIGLFLAAVWGLAELSQRFRHRPPILVAFSIGVLVVLGAATTRQAGYWKNSATLFAHSVKVTENNFLAHNFLGSAVYDQNQEAAFRHYSEAVRINPNYAEAHNNLGTLLMVQNRSDEAFQHFIKAVELKPTHALSQNNLGLALLKRGDLDEAIVHFKAALEAKPDSADAHYLLGDALSRKNDWSEAKKHYAKAVEIQPGLAGAHRNLGKICYMEGNFVEAAAHFQKVLQLNPQDSTAQAALDDALSKAR